MDKKNYNNVVKETLVVNNSGQILQDEIKTISFDREPDYIKLYLDDLTSLYKLQKTQHNVLYALLPYLNYRSEIVLTKVIKVNIAANIGVKPNTIEHTLVELCKNEILIKKGINYYLANPFLFAKGSWKDIKQIRATITWDKTGRKITTNFERKDTQQNLPLGVM